MTKTNVLISIMLLAIIIGSHTVLGWGIALPGNDFTINQGQTNDLKLNIQNYVGDETKKITIDFDGDSKIASIIDQKEYYLLPPKSAEDIILQFSIPKKAKKEYYLSVKFTAHSTDSGLSLTTAKILSFNINVPDSILTEDPSIEEEPEKTEEEIRQELKEMLGEEETKGEGIVVEGEGINIGLTFGIIAIIAVVAIAIALLIMKRKKSVIK